MQATSDTDVLTALFVSDPAALGRADVAVPGGAADTDGPFGPQPGTWAASPVETAAATVLPLAKGAYSLVFMDEQTLYAARDPHGFRPLVLGRLDTGWVVASETAAWTSWGPGSCARSRPASSSASTGEGCGPGPSPRPSRAGACSSTSTWPGRTPRSPAGGCTPPGSRPARLAAEHPADADLVIPVPESGTPAAIGFAEASGIPFGQGLVKNSYVGRTFIQPSQTIRERGIKLKLNPLRDAIAGRSARGGRRHDRPRHHPARAGRHAPRGRRP